MEQRASWFREMTGHARLCLYSNILIVPGLCILIYYRCTGDILNIPLTYLVLDLVIVLWIRRRELRKAQRRLIQKEEFISGKYMENLSQKIEELRQIENKSTQRK